MANLDEQPWETCVVADWAQAAFLLEAGAGKDWRREEDGTTAIMWAAIRGSLETVTFLFN
jgi:ankyrin repeat protein